MCSPSGRAADGSGDDVPDHPGSLERLPGEMKDDSCVYAPRSLRATTATLILDAGVDSTKVLELLGHRHVTTTRIYDKRCRTTSESASHDVAI